MSFASCSNPWPNALRTTRPFVAAEQAAKKDRSEGEMGDDCKRVKAKWLYPWGLTKSLALSDLSHYRCQKCVCVCVCVGRLMSTSVQLKNGGDHS